MNTASIVAGASALAPRLLAWAQRRAAEKSTWIGLAAIAAALGKSVLADHLTSLGNVVPMILGVGGAGLLAASTSARAPAALPLPSETDTTSA